MNIEAN